MPDRWFGRRGAAIVWLVVLVTAVSTASEALGGVVYFLVSERPEVAEHGDSFVVGLEEPDHIDHARDLIARGPDEAGEPILFAQIVAGGDGINRDILAPGKPAWSWHVSAVQGFGDMGLELTDGWPTFVEDDVLGWIENTDMAGDGEPSTGIGHIGFWTYTITAELTGPPTDLRILQPTPIPLPAGLPIGLAVLCGMIVWQRRSPRDRRRDLP